jgi:hypothetical protein
MTDFNRFNPLDLDFDDHVLSAPLVERELSTRFLDNLLGVRIDERPEGVIVVHSEGDDLPVPEGYHLGTVKEFVEILSKSNDPDVRLLALKQLIHLGGIEPAAKFLHEPVWKVWEICLWSQADGHYAPQCPCGKLFEFPATFNLHTKKCSAAKNRTEQENEMKATNVPAHPSNRNIINQMVQWGCSTTPRGEDTEVHLPNGRSLIVRSARTHRVNPQRIVNDVYAALGGSPEAFWAGPAPSTPPSRPSEAAIAAPAPGKPSSREKKRRTRGITDKMLELLIADGGPLTTAQLSEKLGFTREQVCSAASYLVEIGGLVRRIKTGVYEVIDKQPSPDHHVALDITHTNGTASRPAPVSAPIPQVVEGLVPTPSVVATLPDPPFAPTMEVAQIEPSDDEIYAVLDMLVPKGFKAVHYPAVEQWVDSTRNLVAALRQSPPS